MKKRLITSIFIVLGLGLALVSRIWTPFVFDLLILGLAVMGAIEVARVLERQGKYTNFICVATMPTVLYLLSLLVLRLNLIWQYLLLVILGTIILYFALIFIITLCAKNTVRKEMSKYGLEGVSNVRYALDKAMYSLTVLVYPTLLFMALIFINHLSEFSFIDYIMMGSHFETLSWFMLISVFVITMVTDSMAYVVGSTFKGPKLCPLISPNKTISGAVGGLVFGVIAEMLLFWVFTTNSNFVIDCNILDIAWWKVLIIAIFGSIISQFGDILASALKRKSRVKDYGTIFPGHGGVMDRVDGLVFNALLVFVSFVIIFLTY